MATTYTDNGGGAPNGSDLEFTFTFPVLQNEDVKVALNNSVQATTKYAVDTASNPTKITFNNTSIDSSVQETSGAPKSGVTVRVYRETVVGKTNGDMILKLYLQRVHLSVLQILMPILNRHYMQ